jgi:transcriptional regulator with XRE-family HTH domain
MTKQPTMGARSIPLKSSDRERLKSAREARGWTQRDLARRIGATIKHVSEIERGEADPSPRTLQVLCGVLGFRMDVTIERK